MNCIYDISISLKIDTDLSLDEVSDNLSIVPTEVFRKGNKLFKDSDYIIPNNVWVLTEKYPGQGDIKYAIDDFCSKHGCIIAKVKDMQDLISAIRISIISDFAQFGFSLSNTDIDSLKQLCLPIEFSFFSYGIVDDSD